MHKDSRSKFSEGIFEALVLSKALVHYCTSISAHSVFIGNAILNFASAELDRNYLILFV